MHIDPNSPCTGDKTAAEFVMWLYINCLASRCPKCCTSVKAFVAPEILTAMRTVITCIEPKFGARGFPSLFNWDFFWLIGLVLVNIFG